MTSRISLFILLFTITIASAGQSKPPVRKNMETNRRSIRCEVPMTNSIGKGFEAGTRGFFRKTGTQLPAVFAGFGGGFC